MFINEDRYRFVKPITFLFITTLIYALILHIFGVHSTMIQYNIEATELDTVIIDWLISNPRYAITITILLIAFWVRVFFRKAGYNYFEITILLCFITGITTLFDTVAVLINGLMTITNIDTIGTVNGIGFIYMTWGIAQFFGQKKVKNYLKAVLAIILSVFCIALLVVGVVLVSNPQLFHITPSVDISL